MCMIFNNNNKCVQQYVKEKNTSSILVRPW